MVDTRSGRRCESPTPTLTTAQPPSPSVGTSNDAPDDVADLSSKLSLMQSPSKVTKTPPASPTPRLRRSKTPKHDDSSCAGQIHKSNTTMDMDLENNIDDTMANNNLIDNEGTGVDITKDTCCASNPVDNNNEMNVDLENTNAAPPPLNISDTISALLSGGGEPRPDNVKPEGEFKSVQNLSLRFQCAAVATSNRVSDFAATLYKLSYMYCLKNFVVMLQLMTCLLPNTSIHYIWYSSTQFGRKH